jgi:hypothetical protein
MTPQPVIAATPTILPPAPLPAGAQAPSTAPLDVDAALAWIKAEAQAMAYQLNANAAANYLNFAFPNWLANYQHTGDWTMVPPQPPNAVMVEFAMPPAAGSSWFSPQFPAIGIPVCAMPPYTGIQPPPSPGNLAIGVHLCGDYWQVLPTDTIPGGYVTPAPVNTKDGTTGIFQKIGNPTDMFRWYLKVG